MADLTIPKKRQIECLLQMDDGYVLNFWCLRHSLLSPGFSRPSRTSSFDVGG